jgi:predicted dehydrogenase
MNAAEARELVAVAREKKLFLMEAMWTRFLPHVVEIRRLLAEEALGELVAFSGDHGQWIPPNPEHRIFAPELGGGALLDLGVYPVSFASMVLGTPNTIMSITRPAMTGVDGQISMVFGYESGAQALISCTSLAKTPTAGVIVGSEARIEIESEFYRPTNFSVVLRSGERTHHKVPHEGWGLRHQCDEVARCLAAGLLESEVMPLDESITIMATMDEVLAQGRAG